MATADSTPDASTDSPYRRDNWWYDDDHQDDPTTEETPDGPIHTVSAESIMFQELVGLVEPVCERSLEDDGETVELSDPEFYLPKQHDTGERYEEFTQHSTPRRVNPETGYINGGESTTTALPEVDKDTYLQAVHNVLARTGVSYANTEDWLQHAHKLWHDPQYNSTKALTTFIRHKREYDHNQRTEVP